MKIHSAIAGALCGVSIAAAQGLVPVPAAAPPPEPTTQQIRASMDEAQAFDRENKPTDDALDRTLKSFHYQGAFKEGIAQWSAAAGANVAVNERALDASGVDQKATVTVNLNGVSARGALQELLTQLSPETAVGFTVSDNHVVVSTRDDLLSTKYQVIRSYDLGAVGADEASDKEQMELIETIEETVAPDTWRDRGGTVGMIRLFKEHMIVGQTVDNQRLVRNFIEERKADQLDRTRMYDVRDLLQSAAATQPGESTIADSLLAAIEANCGRGTWRDNGGSDSSMAVFDGRLYVTASRGVHEELEHLLALMRKR